MSDHNHLREVAEKIVALDETEENASTFGKQFKASVQVGNLSSKHGPAISRAYLALLREKDGGQEWAS